MAAAGNDHTFVIKPTRLQYSGWTMSQRPSSSAVTSKTVKNIISAADHAVLEEAYTFLPSSSSNGDKEQESSSSSSWKDRMVQKYHNGLYKEYALADLCASRPGQIGLRWRTKDEVVAGRGEWTCGNKRCKNSTTTSATTTSSSFSDDLITLEVPFAYEEHGERKKELVKIKLCPICKPLVVNKNGQKPKDSSSAKKKSKKEVNDDDDCGSSSSSSSSNNNNNNNNSSEDSRQHRHRSRSRKKGDDDIKSRRHRHDSDMKKKRRKKKRRDSRSSSFSSDDETSDSSSHGRRRGESRRRKRGNRHLRRH